MLKNPFLLYCGLAVVVTFFITWFHIRPLGILIIFASIGWILKARGTNLRLVPPPEISSKLECAYNKLSQLRQDRPSFFCAIISTVLIALAIIGHIISGSCIVVFGLIVAGLISTKYQFRIIKENIQPSQTWSSQTTDHDVDEFLPEENETNLFVLERASDEAVISSVASSSITTEEDDEKEKDEIPSELLIPDSIPEIEENFDNSSDDDIILKEPIAESSSTIEFKSGYFNKDSSISSSSSDDDSLTKGLDFKSTNVVDRSEASHKVPQTNIMLQSANQALPHLVSELVAWGLSNAENQKFDKSKKHRRLTDSSEDSDFEILNADDINNS